MCLFAIKNAILKVEEIMAAPQTQGSEKIKSVCFTGHRQLEKENIGALTNALRICLRILINAGVDRFFAGGARGFDTLAALCVLELKKEFPHISLELILPCKNQTKFWSEDDREIYLSIINRADRVEYLHETYTSNCMHDRNRRLVESADICVAYLIHSGGGTAFTVAHALKNSKEFLNIADMI